MKLSDTIWITRKSRIEASNRLDWNAMISQILLTYYSLLLLIITIADLRDKQYDYSYPLLIASIVVLSVSIFMIGVKYKERSLSFKVCYVCLDKLYRRAKRAEDANKQSGTILEKVETDYFEILALSENHADCDFLLAKFRLDVDKTDFKMNWKEWIRLVVFKILRWITVLLLIYLPIYFFYFTILNAYTPQI